MDRDLDNEGVHATGDPTFDRYVSKGFETYWLIIIGIIIYGIIKFGLPF